MSQPASFWGLPVELQARVFELVGAGHTIVVKPQTSNKAAQIGTGLPPVSKNFNAAARYPILRSANWQFSDYAAIPRLYCDSSSKDTAIRYLQHLRIDVRRLDSPSFLIQLSNLKAFAPRTITIIGCSPQNFGVRPCYSATNTISLNFLGTGVRLPDILQETSCHGCSTNTNGIAGSPLVRALQKIESLRNVHIDMLSCDTCELGEIDCDYQLLAHTIEQIILCGRVGLEVDNGQSRDLQGCLKLIESEAMPLIKALAGREEFEPIGTDVGVDFENDLDLWDDVGYETTNN